MTKEEQFQYDAISNKLQGAVFSEIESYGVHGALISDILIAICPDEDGRAPKDGVREEMVTLALKALIERREIFYRLVNMRETFYVREATREFDWKIYLNHNDNNGEEVGRPAPGTLRSKDFFYGGA